MRATSSPAWKREISLDGREYEGLVTGISPEVRSGQVTGRVKFAGDQPPGLRQSQRGSVRIVIEQRAKASSSSAARTSSTGTRAVYVVDGDQAVRTPVELGAASVGEIEVLNGLDARAGSRDLRHAATWTTFPNSTSAANAEPTTGHAMLEMHRHQQDLPHGPDRDARAARLLAEGRRRRVRRGHGPFGLRQDDVHERRRPARDLRHRHATSWTART